MTKLAPVPDLEPTTQDPAERARLALADLAVELSLAFPERRETIDSMMAALVARQHVLLLGPPGVAKSALSRAFCDALEDSVFFDYLFTEFTDPGELFGPFSMSAIQRDKYVRVTDGKLPEATIALLDEVFKANSAILNTTLTLINERLFHNGGPPMRVPLRMLVGASNETPEEGSGCDAFFDRLLVRRMVHPLEDDSAFSSVVWDQRPAISARISLSDLDALHEASRTIQPTDEARQALADIRREARHAGLKVSDRRWGAAAQL